MKEVHVTDKFRYLQFKYPFSHVPALTDRRRCLRCNKEFTVSDYKVFRDESGQENLHCAYAPLCDGTVLDWASLTD